MPIYYIDVSNEDKEQRGELAEELVPISLEDADLEKVTYVGSSLKMKLKTNSSNF